MNRRAFFKSLLGGAAAAAIAPIVKLLPERSIVTPWYKMPWKCDIKFVSIQTPSRIRDHWCIASEHCALADQCPPNSYACTGSEGAIDDQT